MQDNNLYPHQEQVFDALRKGENIILQAPTGSGKTRAALYPFLYCAAQRENFLPLRCIYSPPMRILVKQFFTEYQQTVQTFNLKFGTRLEVRVQTGEQPQAPTLSGNLIFATIDQTLSSYLISPYSLSKRLANLNAGAVMGSYLVFDEFHLFDPKSTLPTTLQMLQTLNGVTPFILMTATFSDQMLGELSRLLNVKVISRHDVDFSEIDSQKKVRRFHALEESLSAETVLSRHRARSVVICNVVERARSLFAELQNRKPADIDDISLLHSQLLAEDRADTETQIQRYFGKDRDRSGSYIIVATQAIEVGVDITCEALHTELAPANAIIQRAGRCARYKGDEGDVYVYRYTQKSGETVDLCDSENAMPYKEQAPLFRMTWEAMQQRSGTVFNFDMEQEVISAVHNDTDAATLRALTADASNHARMVQGVQSGHPEKDARQLIREIASQGIIIHSNPEVLLDRPFEVPAFSLHQKTVQGYIKTWLEVYRAMPNGAAPPWGVKYLYEHDQKREHESSEDAAQFNQSRFVWEEVVEGREAWGAKLIVVHPALATYDKKMGFLAQRGAFPAWEVPLPPRSNATTEGYPKRYRLETYADHIRLVHEEFIGLWSEFAWIAQRLENHFGWEKGSVREAAEMTVLLHDVGKLSRGWQAWVKGYQARIGNPVENGEAYAHTDFDGDDPEHDAAQKAQGKRPWHAVEGAIATVPFFYSHFGGHHPLSKAAFSAIARHHAPFSGENRDFRLIKSAPQHIYSVSDSLPETSELPGLANPISAYEGLKKYSVFLVSPPDYGAFHAYLLIARLLRLADSEGTRHGSLGS